MTAMPSKYLEAMYTGRRVHLNSMRILGAHTPTDEVQCHRSSISAWLGARYIEVERRLHFDKSFYNQKNRYIR